ncbi:hypothetical protein C9J47_00110 [Photobacterium indicum]|uniref:Uncharacterized protein n=1 Tax=Photobacterium indicum TaxID=81447 RepID=A0A2T3LCC3_9GAMM|nr:hypothetical protein C9J47_00110 [Photobacterium indicum]
MMYSAAKKQCNILFVSKRPFIAFVEHTMENDEIEGGINKKEGEKNRHQTYMSNAYFIHL